MLSLHGNAGDMLVKIDDQDVPYNLDAVANMTKVCIIVSACVCARSLARSFSRYSLSLSHSLSLSLSRARSLSHTHRGLLVTKQF